MKHEAAYAAIAITSVAALAAVRGVWGSVIDVASVLGAVLVIGGFLAALGRVPAVKYVWRALVTAPIDRWARSILTDELTPVSKRLDEHIDAHERHNTAVVFLAERVADPTTVEAFKARLAERTLPS